MAQSRADAATIHGGEAAVKSIQRQQPFSGLAAQEQTNVQADLDAGGRAAMVNELAVRLHTASRLYWAALSAVAVKAQEGDAESLKKFDNYVRRFGWLAGAALRAWEQHRKESATSPAVDYDALIEELRDNGR